MIQHWTGYLQQQPSTRTPSASRSNPREKNKSDSHCFRKRSSEQNRRLAVRTAFRMDILMRVITSRRKQSIRAQVENVSGGGICVTLAKPLALASILRCEFATAQSPVVVPTLMQVRWVEQLKSGEYRCGLLYLV